MKKSIALAAILAASIPNTYAEKKSYLGLDIGKASLSWSEYSGDPQVGDIDIVNGDDTSLAISLGSKVNQYFALEMAYNMYGTVDTDVGAPYGNPGAVLTSAEVTALDFGVVGYLPLHEKFALKGMLGVSLWNATLNSNLINEEGEEDGNDIYYGIGAVITPNDKLEVGLSYKILNMGIDGAEELELSNTALNLRIFF